MMCLPYGVHPVVDQVVVTMRDVIVTHCARSLCYKMDLHATLTVHLIHLA